MSKSRVVVENNLRDRPPCTYSVKIQNISQLKNFYSDKGYRSRAFSSGNYNWRLVIYPKGNKNDNGSGFVSMYVELNSTNLASTVLAYLTFFVYNKKEKKYLTIQDGEEKQFNALRPVWGFPQVLPLDQFNDPKNGYVFEGDQCEFGVDVLVPLTSWEVVTISQIPSNRKFSWKLQKFSKLKDNCYESDNFRIEGRNWVLKLYPKGYSTRDSKSLALFLHLADRKKMKGGEMIYTEAEVRILNPLGCNHVKHKLDHWHKKPFSGWGWLDFVSLAKLREAYLDKDDSLTVEIEFEVVSTVKYTPMTP